MFHLHIAVAGGLPLASDGVQGRHHHLVPGGDHAVARHEGGQLVAHGRCVEADRGARETPALLADVTERQCAGRLRAGPTGPVASPGSSGSGRTRPTPSWAVLAASAGGTPAEVSRHISSSIATSCGVQRRCRPSERTAGPTPYLRSQERRVVGDTPRRRARDPVVTPASTGRAAASRRCAGRFSPMRRLYDAQTMRVVRHVPRFTRWGSPGASREAHGDREPARTEEPWP